MNRKMYSVYDKAAEAFMSPFALAADGQAKRAFIDHVMRDENASKFPEDYSIWYVGEFDDSKGCFTAMPEGRVIMTGLEAVAVGSKIVSDAVKKEQNKEQNDDWVELIEQEENQ